MFPYNSVRKNSRVIIYGAGQVGRSMIDSLKENHYCEVVLWIDQFFDNECVKSPNCLLNMPYDDYDHIILATLNPFFAEEMKWNLKDMGIPEERFICMVS